MKKNNFILGTILFCVLIISSGCTQPDKNTATILANPDSSYMTTIEKISVHRKL